ncbi:T9SS type A sorting domain-containing protein [Flavobacterium sp. TP390]|uniref:T9SS type A sorting domain-containing protein n=1 Tax=Flavobacterium profundi TaxID=1774945 RepID=A0A6I4IEZ6_9FLAO|nr:T9SS type A sorting domain-containing protein [Flavobacterium profundi]MVO08128.1 T9SS type A sorting domain-containing protein [Flavobacterium profundi]
MKQIYFFLFICLSSNLSAQIINFPSANLKTKLLYADTTNATAKDINGNQIKIDTNDDNEIDINEAHQVYELDLNVVPTSLSNSINSISGLEYFINVKRFVIHFYYAQTISFSIFPHLEDLTCSGSTQLTMINLDGISNLKKLNLSGNYQIMEFNFSNVPLLEYLNINKTSVTSGTLDLTILPYLKEFYCRSQNLSSLNVQGLINLEKLDLYEADLTTLDLSSNIALKYLDCSAVILLSNLNIIGINTLEYLNISYTSLTDLNLTTNTSLKELIWRSQKIFTLDISTNLNLERLILDKTPGVGQVSFSFNSLNLSHLINLIEFSCNEQVNTPSLTNLDLSGCINLNKLKIVKSSIQNLDLSNNIHLKEISINNSVIESLNLSNLSELEKLNLNGTSSLNSWTHSHFPSLKDIYVENSGIPNLDLENSQLLLNVFGNNSAVDFVNLSSSTSLINVQLNNCPNLEMLLLKNGVSPSQWNNVNYSFNSPSLLYLCVDENNFSTYQSILNNYNNSQCQLNSFCTFVPSGTYYTIDGQIILDYNSNGCDSNDVKYPNLKFKLTNGTNVNYVFSNSDGDLNIPVIAGNNSLVPYLEDSNYFTISPSSTVINFPNQTSPYLQNFCISPIGTKHDLEIYIIPINPARPGFDADYKIIYKNKGNQVENGSVMLTFDDTVLDYLSSNPVYNSLATNSFSWNYTNLLPFETREIEISFNVNSPMEFPAVNNGDVLDFTTSISSGNTDQTPVDNIFVLNQTVLGSYDPNDKICLEGELVDISMVGKYVHYLIRFENTGTYPAQNIVVYDVIDLSKFDINSLIPLQSSHQFYTKFKGNKVEFIFENINLDFNDATNDGYIVFKIKTRNNLAIGQTFSNTASIFFDYNFPIITNEYVTAIQSVLGNQDFVFENEFVLYPNPANEIINITNKNQEEINSVEIYNLVGQIVIAIPNTTNKIDVSSLGIGTYFVKVNTEKGSAVTKFIKE